MKITDVKALEKIANDIRIGVIEAVYSAKSGHPGGSLSCTDILTVLYFNQMNINEKEPNAKARDRFVLSKGHCSPALYSTLARKGYFEKEKLLTFRNIESNLQGHPDMNKVLGVDMTSGSLGQGLSVANGMALASKLNEDGYRVYCLLGDGEIEEGQVWEAAMTSNKYKLDNLCVIVDNNNLQIDGNIEEVKGLTNIGDKFKSFGFEVLQIDGNNIEELLNAFNVAKQIKGRPTVIIAKTIKGKGVSFMENKVEWHGRAPKEEEYKQAIEELSKKYAM
ncbi:MAG TPA: transketolase [Clostridiaceae bacterium]|nr:transketolase [Clostridiaceae bacterium]